MDPVTCCLLGICCPPFSDKQKAAFRKLLAAHLKDDAKAATIANALAGDLALFTEKLAALLKAE